jgi:DNA-binding PadR family transcriptional regulator
VLREARLVKMEKKAQKRIYQFNPEAVQELEEWVRQLTELWNQRFEALDKLLEEDQHKS